MLRALLVLIILFSNPLAMAQQQDTSESTVVEKYGPRRQISTIVYMGLAGAVLGLSTLSFYGRPQDKLTNIPIGFGLGVIVGTVYMTYQAATDPDEFYRESRHQFDLEEAFPKTVLASDLLIQTEGPSFSYSWTF